MSAPRQPKLSPTPSVSGARLQRGVPRLTVVQGPSAGRKLSLTRARATVGRQPTNDLVLDDPRAASTHVELERRHEGRVLVRDLASVHGTWLGTHRIIEAELGPGALVRIGNSVLRVDLDTLVEPEEGIESAAVAGTYAEAKARALERFEQTYLTGLLRRCGGNLSEAARRGDMARNHLRDLLKKRGLYEPRDSGDTD